MAITRLKQAGGEGRSVLPEVDENEATTAFLISSSMPKTGSWAFQKAGTGGNGDFGFGWTGLSSSQCRIGFHFNNNGVTGSPMLARWEAGGGSVACLSMGTANRLIARVGAGSVATGSTAIPTGNTPGNYRHIGIDLKVASAGWFNVYVDGVVEIAWTGNTASAASSFDTYHICHHFASHTWTNNAYWDDIYLDDSSGETAASVVADRRFVPLSASAAGASTNFDVTGTASNFQAVDDFLSGSHDGDTTYVSTSVASRVDFYTTACATSVDLAASNTMVALIVCGVVRKTDAAASTALALGVRSGSSVSYSADKALASSYGWVASRFATDPDTGGNWAGSAAINNAQIGFRSASL
jgi:hypothetical protein